MKKRTIIILTFSLMTVLIGCKETVSHQTAGTGTLSVRIDTTPERVISSDDSTLASTNSNTYEVLIYNETTYLSSIVDLVVGSATLAVEAGDYTVLILAGYSTTSTGILLGSGYRESVSVIEDVITEVSITLNSISHEYTVPSSAACAGQYTVSVTGNTGNPLLHLSSGGTVMENRPYLEMGDNATNLYLDCTVTGSLWTGSIIMTAPAIAETTTIKFYGSNVKLVDPAFSIDNDLKNIGSVNWKWLNESFIPETISDEVIGSIDFVTATSGVSVIVGWS